ncbi:MAG: alpha/beta fold hydrolase, partial [Pseudomonadales bacterium]
MPMEAESILVTVAGGPQLHLKRICENKRNPGTPVLMLHGLVEDGRIFYSQQGKGLAYYLAQFGFDVFVADLRGKGKSWPLAGPKMRAGLHESINEDMPALIKAIVKKRGPQPQIWVSHGWGGVISSAYYARYGEELCPVQNMIYFGTRRYVLPGGLRKKLVLHTLWRRALKLCVGISGYLPARSLHLGTMNESARFYHDSVKWMFNPEWQDTDGEFDYAAAARSRAMPPSLYFASTRDAIFGCPKDVRQFISEFGEHNGRLIVLSRTESNQHDYGHVAMLADPDAEQDHFPELLTWLKQTTVVVKPEPIARR